MNQIAVVPAPITRPERPEPPESMDEEELIERSFTLHVNFTATDEMMALCHASQYAEGLSTLRPEVHCNSARVSTSQDWSQSRPAFCRALGPKLGDICTDVADHGGHHFGSNDRRRWTDEEVPEAANYRGTGAPAR